MKVVIVEDEVLTASRLEKLLLSLQPDAIVAAKLQTVKQSINWFRDNALPDLIFMDIRLSDGISFDIFTEVSIDVPVIFTTAYDEYALEAFNVHGIGYLLKPVEKDKLEACLQKYNKISGKPSSTALLKALEKIESKHSTYRSRFLIPYRDALLPISISDVAYFVSEFKVTYLVTKQGHKHPLELTLEELETQLNPVDFMRVSRQLILSPGSIKRIHNYFNGRLKLELIPVLKDEVIVSRDKSLRFKAWMNQ